MNDVWFIYDDCAAASDHKINKINTFTAYTKLQTIQVILRIVSVL